MVTALHDKGALSHSFNLGADDFIEKPFLPGVLVARVRAKLRRGR
jgi:two-component system response regulator VanR